MRRTSRCPRQWRSLAWRSYCCVAASFARTAALLRVEFANGWGLIRPSNTTPSLTFRFEADDEGALEEIKARFRDLLRRVAPDMHAPF